MHPDVNAEFVARMKDVLGLYAEPRDPLRPVVCSDETPRQSIGEERVPIRAEPGKPRRYDYEYVRNGTANVFMFVDVNRPWRHAKVTFTGALTDRHGAQLCNALACCATGLAPAEAVDVVI